MFNTTKASTAPTRRRKRRGSGLLAALSAAVALGAVGAGTVASGAEAKTIYWGVYPNLSSAEVSAVCEYGYANQYATTRTRYLEINSYENADGAVQLNFLVLVNGVPSSSSGWYNVGPGYNNWRYSLGQGSGPAVHIVVLAQFRNWINGSWVYSPNGAWSKADHTQKVTMGGILYNNYGTGESGCYL